MAWRLWNRQDASYSVGDCGVNPPRHAESLRLPDGDSGFGGTEEEDTEIEMLTRRQQTTADVIMLIMSGMEHQRRRRRHRQPADVQFKPWIWQTAGATPRCSTTLLDLAQLELEAINTRALVEDIPVDIYNRPTAYFGTKSALEPRIWDHTRAALQLLLAAIVVYCAHQER
ncbi:hypothetical protein GGTG_08299 [Gaeumannomyces tritici R3-111a-1]|uniref:Uncharacterized protein n=1 Tax=Gaeumannomyces tritici (strain R3-111a-1) TaxID=644352 RepID=J3P463_GAET3|nr:hypothetical protein GGTG_08299 [Gaeumannomyces tritici R3-111a-1]EJT74459.1 hypothetical protein GGTG_08299 [Gaeumannomyces tritici R3-111a-1]